MTTEVYIVTHAPKHPTKRQAQQAAAALSDLLTMFQGEGHKATAQRITTALELTQQAALTANPAQRSKFMGTALLYLSPSAAAKLLAQQEGKA